MSHRWVAILALLAMPLTAIAQNRDVLRVGFSAVDITPDLKKPVYLAGFGKNRVATRVHDPIMARAVILAHGEQKIAIVTVDLIGLFHDNVERVRSRIKGITYLLVNSTHNHEGPDTIGMWGPSLFVTGVDPDYLTKVEDGIVRAIEKADGSLAEAPHVRIGQARDADLLNDSRKPIVKHDELTAIQFLDASKKTLGVIATWNCHPEVLDRDNKEVSADFVWATVAHLEKEFAAPVVYLTGTVGGLMSAPDNLFKDADGKPYPRGSFEKTEKYGQAVGRLAQKALADGRAAPLTPFTVQRREIYLPIDNNGYKLGYSLGVLKRNAFGWTGDASRGGTIDKDDKKQRLAAKSEIARLRLGELDVAVIPGEIYPELVLGQYQDPVEPGADFPDAPLEPSIYSNLDAPFRMIVGLGNDEIGYIIPKRQWDEKAPFCYGRKTGQYGEINSLGPETAPLICDAFRAMTKKK